ncbi:MAG: MerR family transcriptional regulator [Clostridiaceae bacterium]|nr:MerR family transcriptional regulator [Clostridiaceae bacterium]
MSNTYSTSEIAKLIGIHPNTVRLYEELELIPIPRRKPNGYRIFEDIHLEQFRLARTALQVGVLQNGLRKRAMEIVKVSAAGDFDQAIKLAEQYLRQIQYEITNAEEAIRITEQILNGSEQPDNSVCLTRKETADYLQISIDALRNWEMNGLLKIKRRENGYRVYTDEDLKTLKIIRSLRCANYSLSAILRMLNTLSDNPGANIRVVIDSPNTSDDIISVCDKLLTSLSNAEQNASRMLSRLHAMKNKFS